jgi:long-chain acyl-CoA synthetase
VIGTTPTRDGQRPPLSQRGSRPWHGAWPPHLGPTLEYPAVPAWWLLERNLPRFGARVAVREVDHETLAERATLTYAELFDRARAGARGLQQCGVQPGARVGLVLPNSSALILGYYATWLAGAVAVPANPAAHEHELERQLDDAGVGLIVGRSGSSAEAVAARLGRPFLDQAAFRALQSGPRLERPAGDPDDLAVLLYTGGTTGRPKGAMLTHRNVVTNTVQFAEWYAFVPGDEVSICAIPMYHSGGMSGVMNVPLYAGATLVVLARFQPAAVARAVTRYRATRLLGVPTMFIALLDDEEGRRADYSSLRACRTNAAPLPPAVKAAFDGLVGREVLVEGYGLTETSPLTHANPIHRPRAGSIGIPLPDTDARVVDLETGEEVGPGRPGELLVRGPQVMRGYWNQPAETAAVLADGWFRTGDVAVMDADGYFAIVDRKKDVINTAGFKVWPREVEEVLYTHPAVKQAAVVGVPDPYRGEAVKAYVVLKADPARPVTEAELIEFCRGRLTAYKAPRAVEFRSELPMTATGKVLRRLLRPEPAPGRS